MKGRGNSGTGGEAPHPQRKKGVDRRAHLLGDGVDEPDVQVLLRADTCGGGGARGQGRGALPRHHQPIGGVRPRQPLGVAGVEGGLQLSRPWGKDQFPMLLS